MLQSLGHYLLPLIVLRASECIELFPRNRLRLSVFRIHLDTSLIPNSKRFEKASALVL
jgi:hypothetical protein